MTPSPDRRALRGSYETVVGTVFHILPVSRAILAIRRTKTRFPPHYVQVAILPLLFLSESEFIKGCGLHQQNGSIWIGSCRVSVTEAANGFHKPSPVAVASLSQSCAAPCRVADSPLGSQHVPWSEMSHHQIRVAAPRSKPKARCQNDGPSCLPPFVSLICAPIGYLVLRQRRQLTKPRTSTLAVLQAQSSGDGKSLDSRDVDSPRTWCASCASYTFQLHVPVTRSSSAIQTLE